MTALAPATAPVPPAIQREAAPPISRHRIAMLVGFIALHAPLAMAMRSFQILSTLHAGATLIVGIAIAATTRQIKKVSYIAAYIAGAEVLWRMTRAGVFWEYGKYATVAVLLIALLRIPTRRNRTLSLAYFGLLIPSIALTLAAEGLARAREDISFNLSGPLALALCAIFFSNVRLRSDDLRRGFFALLGPAFGIASLSYLSTSASEDIVFINASNFTASGGFGPNQVSAVLGLGILFALLMLFERRSPWRLRIPLLAIATLFAALSALTFSRGGLIMALISSLTAALYLIRGGTRARITLIGIASIVFALGRYVVEPRLDEFTQGKLSERYASAGTSGRDKFMLFELDVFTDNPVLGVGPGMLTPLREEEFGMFGAAHTEYTRMLAEHGLLGALSLLLLVALAVRVVRTTRTLEARAVTFALVTWVAMFLMFYGIRLVAPAFVFGLACSISYTSREPPP